MKLFLLNGHGINIRVDTAKLVIKEGRHNDAEEPNTYFFRPKRIDVDHVVVYGRSGQISFDAIRWLVKHNVQVSFLDWDGKLLTTILPPESVMVDTKFAQYQAYGDMDKRIMLSKKFIEAKFTRTEEVLNYLNTRHPEISTDISKETKRLDNAKDIPEIMMIEGRVASHYWQQLNKIIPKEYEFETREYQKRPRGAGDTVNCLLNYGYAILEAECLKAINTSGLDAHVGFLHEKRMGKNSLAYDFQELFRWLIDLAVLDALERRIFKKSDFIRSETYTLRLRPSGAKKLIATIDKHFDTKVRFRGSNWSWRYVLQKKVQELAHYLVRKRKSLDFRRPRMEHKRNDTYNLRETVSNLSYVEWQKQGFSKGSLHYLKKNASSNKPFTVNKHMKERLLALTEENGK